MPICTEAQVRQALQRGEVAPVYLLLGDDEERKEGLMTAFASLVEPALQGFNVERFHATDARLADVLAAARTLPMLGTRRVVFWVRAEIVLRARRRAGPGETAGEGADLAGTGEPAEAEDDIQDLERYLASPSASTCLVIVAADLDRGRRVSRQLLAQAVVVEFPGLGTGRQGIESARAFVRDRVRAEGLSIDGEAIGLLVEHAGTDVGLLKNAVDQVITYCRGRSAIRGEDVRAVVSGAVPLDDWAVVNAIERGNAAEAMRQVGLLLDEGAAPLQVLGQISWFVRTRLARALPPDRVRAAVEAVFRTDQAIKTSAGDPQVLLERLAAELSLDSMPNPARPRESWQPTARSRRS
jgi:DNA polymerase-3 subunit delta